MVTNITIYSKYTGCGPAWAVFDQAKKKCFYIKLDACCFVDSFKEYREKSFEKLRALKMGKIISGIFSGMCFHFKKPEDAKIFDLDGNGYIFFKDYDRNGEKPILDREGEEPVYNLIVQLLKKGRSQGDCKQEVLLKNKKLAESAKEAQRFEHRYDVSLVDAPFFVLDHTKDPKIWEFNYDFSRYRFNYIPTMQLSELLEYKGKDGYGEGFEIFKNLPKVSIRY